MLLLDHTDRTTSVVRTVAFGADHAGYRLKESLKPYLEQRGIRVVDMGTDSQESTDYPGYAHAVAEAVVGGRADRGLLICGTGIGMAMAANRHPGVRAAHCSNPEYARLSRAHNDANILTLGGRLISLEEAVEVLNTFLDTSFDGGRHQTRIEKLNP